MMKLLLFLSLIYLSANFIPIKADALQNPCIATTCSEGSLCYAKPKPGSTGNTISREPVCVDACQPVKCAAGPCITVTGPCGNSFCKPKPLCAPSCVGVTCKNNNSCTMLPTLPYGPGKYTTAPFCGRDPCETKVCPKGQGCYLQVNSYPFTGSCSVQPVCKDPCSTITCNKGEYCKSEVVTCIKAPCNPIPSCVNPCDSKVCPVGKYCVSKQVQCFAPPCYPIAECEDCTTYKCPKGQHCDILAINCLVAPCPSSRLICVDN